MVSLVAASIFLLLIFTFVKDKNKSLAEDCPLKFQDRCFYLYAAKPTMYSYALETCKLRGTFLSLPNNKTGLGKLANVLAKNSTDPFVGVHKDLDGSWKREDGQKFDKRMWDKGEPSNSKYRCAIINHKTGKLKAENCFASRMFVCQSCVVELDNVCFTSEAEGYGLAYPGYEPCSTQSKSDDPLEPLSFDSLRFLKDMAKSVKSKINKTRYVWVGVTKIGENWVQANADRVDKSMWDKGEPRKPKVRVPRECAALHVTTGKLKPHDCTDQLPAICQRPLALKVDTHYVRKTSPKTPISNSSLALKFPVQLCLLLLFIYFTLTEGFLFIGDG